MPDGVQESLSDKQKIEDFDLNESILIWDKDRNRNEAGNPDLKFIWDIKKKKKEDKEDMSKEEYFHYFGIKDFWDFDKDSGWSVLYYSKLNEVVVSSQL